MRDWGTLSTVFGGKMGHPQVDYGQGFVDELGFSCFEALNIPQLVL